MPCEQLIVAHSRINIIFILFLKGSLWIRLFVKRIMQVANPLQKIGPFRPPTRLLCGPGPANAHPRVHASMALPQLGHLDPAFINICEDVKSLIRYVWQTEESFTLPVSGTGSAAWEAVVASITQPNDVHLTFVNGYFGERHCDMSSRYGAIVKRVDKPWGEVFSLEEIEAAIKQHQPQIVWVCSAETSTGALQPLEGIGPLCKANNCLFVLDTVTSMGGVPLKIDSLGVDACYSASQKCLACPSGISVIMLNLRALKKLRLWAEMGKKVPNWYLDMSMIEKYIMPQGNSPRVYHHTAPISMIYALREALTIIAEEGLENVWARHQATAEYFWSLIEDSGLEMYIPSKKHRIASLHTIKVPSGVDPNKVIIYMRDKLQIEIGGGLGSLAGKVWRVGLMGYNSRPDVALIVAKGLVEALKEQSWTPPIVKNNI